MPFPVATLISRAARFLGGVIAGLVIREPGALLADSSPAPSHWAFISPVRPPLPEPRTLGWAQTPVDRFIIVRLESQGQSPAPEADRRTLIRRLSFDLRGIPPTPDEVGAFLSDSQREAWANLVDQFLASPSYGERWGRHWLDIAGYADSNGYFNADSDRPLAWQYRDYVVRSINEDRPFDRFIQEQVAGDELVGYVPDGDVTPDMVDPLIATHFFRNPPDGSGESDGNPLEVKVDKYAVIEGNVQLIGHAFLGLTLQCARCHDHKFEPITQTEYYGLQAILRPAFDPDHWLKPNERTITVGTRAEREDNKRRIEAGDRELKTLRAGLEGLIAPFRRQFIDENLASLDEAVRKSVREALDTKEKERTEAMKTLLKQHATLVDIADDALAKRFPDMASARRALDSGVARVEATRPAPLPKIAALFEPTGTPPAHHLLSRGVHANEGAEVGPCVPASLCRAGESTNWFDPTNSGKAKPATSGRRLALARWLTAPDNPLVARVLVNRVWAHHFGQGLVPTVDNLGRSGAKPTHPELLDWLATEFVRSGWSLKHLHRLILNSATWKQAGEGEGKLIGDQRAIDEGSGVSRRLGAVNADDPNYARFPLRRLDAEASRDAILAVSGELDWTSGGHYVPIKTDEAGQIVVDETRPDSRRRSLYLQQRRTQPVAWLQVFDGPQPNPVCIQRNQATVALQSLSMLNSDFIRRHSRAFAERLHASGHGIDQAFELAWSRPPVEEERAAAERFLATQSTHYSGQSDANLRAWSDLCQMLLASNQFLYVE
ncbi:MAG TPA: DUF1549 and DUF1553 domain-containing protein [Verrucomicrobiota bacterium]|nr:DUF1549 and DUF1553 domain-containing protein [Verrucomicrobiota bacterium]